MRDITGINLRQLKHLPNCQLDLLLYSDSFFPNESARLPNARAPGRMERRDRFLAGENTSAPGEGAEGARKRNEDAEKEDEKSVKGNYSYAKQHKRRCY